MLHCGMYLKVTSVKCSRKTVVSPHKVDVKLVFPLVTPAPKIQQKGYDQKKEKKKEVLEKVGYLANAEPKRQQMVI